MAGQLATSMISTFVRGANGIQSTPAAVKPAAVAASEIVYLFWATERRRTLAQANTRLEHRVAERTEELTRANTQLRQEVSERLSGYRPFAGKGISTPAWERS